MNYLKTFSTRMVAGELTTESLRLPSLFCGGSSRGLLDADVAMAKAAAAVDVLLLLSKTFILALERIVILLHCVKMIKFR